MPIARTEEPIVSRSRRALLALVAALAVGVAACGDSDGGSGSDTTTATTTGGDAPTTAALATSSTAATSSTTSAPSGTGDADVEQLQTQLTTVGCYDGELDGISGPATVAAVEAFQEAAGLTVDGIPGPQTQGALDDAVANGETACTGGGDGSGAGDGDGTEDGDGTGDGSDTGDATGDSTVQLASASFSAGFTVLSCDDPAPSTLALSAENESSIELDVMATDGTGTLSVSGATGEDAITLTGDVETVLVGDTGALSVTGTFTGDDLAGESFTLTGSCA